MAATTGSTTQAPVFERVLAEFRRDLTQNEQEDFSYTSSVDLKQAIMQLQSEQKSEKRMQNLNRIGAFLEAMDQFDKVIHVFLNTSDYLGFIWGPAKFMLLVAGSHVDALNILLNAYQDIGEHMPLLAQYESHISQNPSLQEILGLIYKDILTFHHKAMKQFRQRAWRKLFHATWRTFRTEFDMILTNLGSHRRLLDSQAIYLGVQETMNAVTLLQESNKVIEEDLRRRQEQDLKTRQLSVASWLSAADSASDHENSLSIYEDDPEDGNWLFEQDVVKGWMEKDPVCGPLLWINGKPGAGKTILASRLIERCAQESDSDVIYFYCKHGDTSRDNFLGFARGIIAQMAKLKPVLLQYILDQQASSGTNSLNSARVAKQALDTITESFSNLVLVIDGLDECVKSQKREICSWVRKMIDVSGIGRISNLRCCVFSQDDNDIGKLLRGSPTLKIKEEHNREEISRFCNRRSKRLGDDFGLSSQDLKGLNESVTRNADGMFLYAKLVLANLEDQVSRAAVKDEMKRIPPDLNQIYHRIRHRIFEESSIPEGMAAKSLLCWMLCAKRPLYWHEIQAAMSLDLSDGSFSSARRLRKDMKQLCGSLIELHADGSIHFVHLTAKFFLRDDVSLPQQLEHLKLTRLCFTQLSLESHGFLLSSESMRDCIERGEYGFTEYAIIYAFDHLLDVLSQKATIPNEAYASLMFTLHFFLNSRVIVPATPSSIDKTLFDKVRVLEKEKHFHELKYAIMTHREALDESIRHDKKSVFPLLEHLMLVRSLLETTASPTESLKSLYGPNHFKCSYPRCKFFYIGFPTKSHRTKHYKQHERLFSCSISGCMSAIIGFSDAASLQRHEQEYHSGQDANTTFPWNGKLESMDLAKEVKNGNSSALDLWLSQKDDEGELKGLTRALIAATVAGHLDMLEKIVARVSKSEPGDLRSAVQEGFRVGNEKIVQFLLAKMTISLERYIFEYYVRALQVGMDDVAKYLLGHLTSALITKDKPARQLLYLNMAIRYNRLEIFLHILTHYELDLKSRDSKGNSTLDTAAECNRIAIAQCLIKTYGCDASTPNKHGDLPLVIAARQGHEEFITTIYRGYENGSSNVWLKVARLHNSVIDGDYEKVKNIIEGGLERLDEIDARSRSPWIHAVEGQHFHIMELLLSQPNINFNRRAPYRIKSMGFSVIHFIASYGNHRMMRKLLESRHYNAELNQYRFPPKGHNKVSYGGTPREIAQFCQWEETVRVIDEYTSSLAERGIVTSHDVSSAIEDRASGVDFVSSHNNLEEQLFDFDAFPER